ncbi:MAG: hypothetical protein NC452_10305 [Eubacterium sp.]|nr:hypothetical protein [Eubacterium sp.]
MEQQSNGLVINPHNFEDKKNEMRAFAQSMPQEIELSEFETKGGLFKWGNHTVTGTEMNNFTSEIQKHLIELNNRDKKIAGQINTVYETFETLDKDYIQKILISIKSAETANEKANVAIKALKATTTKLSNFKASIESIEHLYHIDDIWNACQESQEAISMLSKSINHVISCNNKNAQDIVNLKQATNAIKEQISDLSNLVKQQAETLETVTDFTDELEKIAHLQDVDEMYDSLANTEKSLIAIGDELDNIKNDFSAQRSDVVSLLSFMEEMRGFTHLNDIDNIWDKSREQQDNLNKLQANLSSNSKSIEELREYKSHLSQIKHLDDVDILYENSKNYSVRLEKTEKQNNDTLDLVKSNKESIDELHKIEHLRDIAEIWKLGEAHSNQLLELNNKNDEISDIIQQNKESTEAAITDIVEKNDSFVQTFTKKIKYVYVLAGGALGVAVIELIVILLKVI